MHYKTYAQQNFNIKWLNNVLNRLQYVDIYKQVKEIDLK